ncbi:MAG TPA: hypothetical protein VLB44_23555 [Kofleriaceae bacterium]|nr:hypothetical protein [Kofleriaceae bacterium]
MKRLLVGLALVSGCGDDDCCKVTMDAAVPDSPGPTQDANLSLTEVALVPATVNRDVDLLFIIDDSPSMLDKQANLKSSFPNLVSVLATVQGGLPNIHLGVITTDMGSKGADDTVAGPGIGSGPGSCSGSGKDGVLQTFGAPVTGNYLSDLDDGTGNRVKNYTGTLEAAFSAMASAGAGGCGFEQPLAALRRSFENATNAGFIRSTARLAIVLLSDEDDCSMSHSTLMGSDTATLGPLQSFRCTRFGVQCDVAGTTTDEMNALGGKDACHSNEQSAYVADLARYSSFLSTLKADPREVIFGAIVGATSPFSVEPRSPPGGGTAIPALAHSCSYTGAAGTEVADPPARIAQLAGNLRRGSIDSVCNGNLAGVMTSMGQRIKSLVGDPCLVQSIAMPATCEAVDVRGSTQTVIPACSATTTTDCFTVVQDATLCPAGQQLKLDVVRSSPPTKDTWTSLRCAI